MKYLWISVLALIAACTTANTTDEEQVDFQIITFASTQATAAEKADCEKAGGEVLKRGRLRAEHCVQPYPDAGKECSDASDCLGRCLLEVEIENPVPGTASTGVCQADTNDFGCQTLINGGKMEGTICID